MPAPILIGSVPVAPGFVLAPIDGYTDLAFRIVCRRSGAGLCFTEMIPAIALTLGVAEAVHKMAGHPEDRPLAVQIAGNEPEVMAAAARIAEDAGADMVDINAGCPSRRTVGHGAGAALLSDLPRLAAILARVRAAIRVPLTLKVRSGPTASRMVLGEVARMVADTGVEAVTVHPRTASQGFSGRADWSLIADFRQRVACPVFGNGDVRTAGDGLRMLRETGCDGVMIGRGALGNPWLFGDLAAAFAGRALPGKGDLKSMVIEHFDLLLECVEGDEKLAARRFRKHLVSYLKGFPGASALRRALPGVESRRAIEDVLRSVG